MNIRNTEFFEGCGKKVTAMAQSSFKKKSCEMSSDKKEKASLRMKKELETIINNGYFQELYLLKVIVEHALTLNRLISIGGQISYSYIAYLLGISTIEPIERDYEVEMLWGFHQDRNPYMVINAANDYKESLVVFLRGIFGEEKVRVDDLSITLGEQTNGIDNMTIGFLGSDLIKLAEDVLPVKNNNSESSFKLVRDSILSSHYPSGKIPYENIVGVVKMLLWLINNEEQPYSDKTECFALFDGTYDGLLRGLAAIRGTGVAEADLRDSNNKRILTRDDFFRFGLSLFGNEKDADDFMTQIRKGRGRDLRYQGILERKEVPLDVRNKLKKVQYTVSEGSLITEAQLVLFSATTIFHS